MKKAYEIFIKKLMKQLSLTVNKEQLKKRTVFYN